MTIPYSVQNLYSFIFKNTERDPLTSDRVLSLFYRQGDEAPEGLCNLASKIQWISTQVLTYLTVHFAFILCV